MIKTLHRILLWPMLLLASLPLAAQDTFVFSPQWSAQAQFAGFYAALENGFYQEEGLDVKIVHPNTVRDLELLLTEGASDATTLPLMQALVLVDQGIQLVNILQTSMNNATVIVSRRGKNPLDQHGARVGTWQAGFDQIAICVNKILGLNYEWVPFAANVNLFISGALDATLAMSYNEYNLLLQAGAEIHEENVYRFSEHGYNIQDDGVYMTLEAYRKDPDRAERFARASRRGWEWAAEHPEETLDLVMEYVERNHIATNRVLQQLMLEEILNLQVDARTGQREFRLVPEMVRMATGLMMEADLISSPIGYYDLIAR